MRLLVLAFAVLLGSTACSLTSPDREEGLVYSGAFANWFYQTNSVSLEAWAVHAAVAEGGEEEDGLRMRLRELATTQTSINEQFSSMQPHPFWAEYHPAIVEATTRFDAATAHLREGEPLGPIAPLVDLFTAQESDLLQAVISCYTQTDQCPPERR